MQKIVVFLILFFTLGSCRKMVQDEFPGFESITTVNAFLAANSVINIHVSKTGKIDNAPLSSIKNAKVYLYINDSIVELPHTDNGIYTSGAKAAIETEYRCEVVTGDNSLSEAFCSIPAPPVLLSAQLYPDSWLNDEGIPSPTIRFSIENDASEVVYFEARVIFYRKSIYEHDSIDFRYNEEQPVALFTNEQVAGTVLTKSIEFAPESRGSNSKNAYVLELRALSQSAYKYLKSIELYELGRYPDFGTGSVVPYNLYNNVTNGYGIFAGYSCVFSDMLIDNTKRQP